MFSAHSKYAKPKAAKSAFGVEHFAGLVSYEVQGFLEKNKDSLSTDIT